MSRKPQYEVRDTTSSMGDIVDSIIEEITEDIENVETGDIEIDNTTPPTIVDYVITWWDIHGEEAILVVSNPNIGYIFFDKTITDKEKW